MQLPYAIETEVKAGSFPPLKTLRILNIEIGWGALVELVGALRFSLETLALRAADDDIGVTILWEPEVTLLLANTIFPRLKVIALEERICSMDTFGRFVRTHAATIEEAEYSQPDVFNACWGSFKDAMLGPNQTVQEESLDESIASGLDQIRVQSVAWRRCPSLAAIHEDPSLAIVELALSAGTFEYDPAVMRTAITPFWNVEHLTLHSPYEHGDAIVHLSQVPTLLLP